MPINDWHGMLKWCANTSCPEGRTLSTDAVNHLIVRVNSNAAVHGLDGRSGDGCCRLMLPEDFGVAPLFANCEQTIASDHVEVTFRIDDGHGGDWLRGCALSEALLLPDDLSVAGGSGLNGGWLSG